MVTFREYFGMKPKAEKPLEEEKGLAQIGEEDKKLEQVKKDFILEKQKLEQRLTEIPAKIKDLEQGLANMKGPEIRRILDKEFELNSALSPVDSTDPNKAREYEMWVSALKDSRAATQEMKADIGRRIDKYQSDITKLENEKREIEKRIQR